MTLEEQKPIKTARDLQLLHVAERGRLVSGEIELAAKLYAALELHEEQETGGPEKRTIKEILYEDLNLKDTLLTEYVAAFGAHGKQVLIRFAQRQPEGGWDKFIHALDETRTRLGVQNVKLP